MTIEIFERIDGDTTILTPNRRLSANLHKLYQEYQLSQGHSCWHTPDILPLTSWLQRLWQQYTIENIAHHPLLLDSVQEQFVWEKVLMNAKESQQLLQVSETAELAKSAYALLQQWQIDINQPAFQASEDYIALTQWIKEYRAQCQANHWIDTHDLPGLLKKALILFPKKLILIGFTEISPQMRDFLPEFEMINHSLSACDTGRIALENNETELLTIARWAKETNTQHPEARIACVIPDLESTRDRVAQIFAEVFAEESCYNISAGKPLTHYPIIDVALQLLTLHKKSVPGTIFSYLLTSPFLGEAETERTRRSAYELYLRRSNITTVKFDFVTLDKYCPKLTARIKDFFAIVDGMETTQTYAAWAEQFTKLLNAMGWPGERSLSSVEYQIVESWLDLLNKFAALDQVASPTNFLHALSNLHKMATKSVFQAKTPDASIQILGVLEAAGIPFDYAWIAGLNDVNWPPRPMPHPFIPKKLQRELNMPHATAEREFNFCTEILRQFKNVNAHLIFSYAKKSDEIEFKASPLIMAEKEIQLELQEYSSLTERVYHAKQIEKMVDDKAPAILDTNENIRGGVSILKYQAACPFRAFAEWRLHAHRLEDSLPGLRAKDRGTIIHKSLELIWSALSDHSALINMQLDDLKKLINNCIDKAMILLPASHQEATQYVTLEKQRLLKLLLEWMENEKQRPPFRVLQNEATIEYQLQKLKVKIRVDRVDELHDGKKLIIDYKTNKTNNVNAWFDPRLDEPQLPLYALIDADNTSGICFAQINAGEHLFKGVSHYDLEIKGIKKIDENKKAAPNWHEQIANWKKDLAQLADDFSEGKAAVNPKDPDQTCTWCALEPLCRKNEEAFEYES